MDELYNQRLMNKYTPDLKNLTQLNCKICQNRKGVSQVLYLIVAASVLMIVALGVIFIFQSGFGDFGEWTTNMTGGGFEEEAEQVNPG